MRAQFFRTFVTSLILSSQVCFAQGSEIVKLLNHALREDLKIEPKYNHFDNIIKIVKPYSISDGILSVQLEYTGNDGHYTEKQEVPLSKITAIGKDINVIFDTEEDAVSITRKNLDANTTLAESAKSNLFFTGIRFQRQNKYLSEDLQYYFEKAGYKIGLGSWYD